MIYRAQELLDEFQLELEKAAEKANPHTAERFAAAHEIADQVEALFNEHPAFSAEYKEFGRKAGAKVVSIDVKETGITVRRVGATQGAATEFVGLDYNPRTRRFEGDPVSDVTEAIIRLMKTVPTE